MIIKKLKKLLLEPQVYNPNLARREQAWAAITMALMVLLIFSVHAFGGGN